MGTNKLHIVILKSLRLLFLTFALLFGANVAYGQTAVLLNPHGDGDSHWMADGTADCHYLKARFSYLCPLSTYAYNYKGKMIYASSKHMKTFQRISKADGVADISSNNYVRKTCLSISYDKDWVEPNVADDRIEPGAKAIIYAYSKGNETDGYDIYYYISDDDPNTNDDEIYAVFQPNSNAQNLFQNGDLKKAINGNTSPLLESVDLSGWDFGNVVNLDKFFSNCKKMRSVDFGTSVNFSNVTNLTNMFLNCSALTSVNFGSTIDFSNVNNIANMFSGCNQLTESTIKEMVSRWVINKNILKTKNQTFDKVNSIKKKSVLTANELQYNISNNGSLDDPVEDGITDMTYRNLGADQFGQNISFTWDVMFEKNVTKYTIKYIDDDDEVDENDEENWTEIYKTEFDHAVSNTVSFYNPAIKNAPKTLNGAKKYKIIATLTDGTTLISDYISLECSLLPIELSYFSVVQNGESSIDFEWETATETNNDYFTIEQSFDGISFHEVAQIAGAGTSSTSNSYEYSMLATFSGLMYFRLKQTDYNGDYSYSDVQTIFVGDNEYVILYPTIATDFITIEGDYESVKFIDMQGKIQHPTRMQGNTYPIAALPQGMHYAIISLKNGEIVTRQFFKK